MVITKSVTVYLISLDQLITGTDLTAGWPAGAMLVAFILMFFVIVWRLIRRVRGEVISGAHHF